MRFIVGVRTGFDILGTCIRQRSLLLIVEVSARRCWGREGPPEATEEISIAEIIFIQFCQGPVRPALLDLPRIGNLIMLVGHACIWEWNAEWQRSIDRMAGGDVSDGGGQVSCSARLVAMAKGHLGNGLDS